MKSFALLLIPVILISSCSTDGKNPAKSSTTQTGVSQEKETPESVGVIRNLRDGFVRKGCSLLLESVVVDDYQAMDCNPSEEDIEKSIANNTIHTITLGNLSIEAPDSLRITSTKTYFTDFALYAEDMKNTFIPSLIQENSQNTFSKKEIEAEIEKLKGHYSFEIKKINGFNMVIHKRDFYGMTGEIYQVFIFTGNGEIIDLYTSSYPKKLDDALKTLKKVK